jgi:hypothetical protein
MTSPQRGSPTKKIPEKLQFSCPTKSVILIMGRKTTTALCAKGPEKLKFFQGFFCRRPQGKIFSGKFTSLVAI